MMQAGECFHPTEKRKVYKREWSKDAVYATREIGKVLGSRSLVVDWKK